MRIGILGGTGPAGQALAARLASVGDEVVIGSRSKERAAEIVSELVGKWPDHELAIEPHDNEGAASAEVVVVATPWDGAAETTRAVAGHLTGKVVICMANALARVDGEFQALIPPRGSVAEHVQAAAPGALVAAALQHAPARELGAIDHPLDMDVLVSSDHAEASRVTAEIVGRIPGCRALQAGRLSSASAIEAFTAVILQVNVRYKTRAAIHFTGIPDPD